MCGSTQDNFVVSATAVVQIKDSELSKVRVGNNAKRITKSINTFVKSNVNEYDFPGQFYVLKSIIHKQLSVAIDKESLGILANIVLADPEFNKPMRIGLLIGAESFFELLPIGQIKLGSSCCSAQFTNIRRFWWSSGFSS